MPKVDDLVAALKRLKEQYVKNKLPQVGFFSTLDELIAEAPFEKVPFQQWKNYLKPGRVLEREGVRFPLKQEELDYTFGQPHAQDEHGDIYIPPDRPMTKEELRQWIRALRPDFGLRVGLPAPPGLRGMDEQLRRRFPEEYEIQHAPGRQIPGDETFLDYSGNRPAPEAQPSRWRDYAHEVDPSRYEESALESGDFGQYDTHFGPEVLSHSRTTVHDVPETVQGTTEGSPSYTQSRLLRLIEEIQSDRHQAAATRPGLERAIDAVNGIENVRMEDYPRQGYQTPEDLEEIRRLTRHPDYYGSPDLDTPEGKAKFAEIGRMYERVKTLKDKIPDAPFKRPEDYAGFEMRNQLLNAAKQGQDYLGLVSGKDVSDRFGQDPPEAAGTSHIYDKIYPSQLEKLARQYGIEMKEAPIRTKLEGDIRPEIMQEFDVEDMEGMVDLVVERASEGQHSPEDVEMALGVFDDLLSSFKTGLARLNDPRVDTLIQAARVQKRNLGSVLRSWNEIATTSRNSQNPVEVEARAKLRQAHADMTEALDQLWSAWRGTYGGRKQEVTKKFKSMELTPEIRDKIRRIGVPIWSLTPAALLGLGANEEEQGFAEGGQVNDSDLAYLRRISEELADREEGSEKRNRRMGAGWASQMYGLDSEGKMRLFGGINLADVLVPQRILESYRRNIKGEPDVKKYGPGLLDEVRSMFLGTKGAEEADARLAELRNRINEQLELEEAQGFEENFDEALGVMAGQIPVPAMAARTAATELAPKTALKKLVSLLPEWFTPTVTPSPTNYTSGAVVGGGLGTLADEEPKIPEERVRKAEGGKVEASDTAGITRMISQLQGRLQMLSAGLPDMPSLGSIEAPEAPERLMKAEGGKVKTLLDLRKALAAKLSSPDVEGTGKELQRLRDSVAQVPSQSVTPVAPERSTPESLISLVSQPVPSTPSAPFQMSRRTALQGLASMLSPVDVPVNLKDLAVKQLTKAVEDEIFVPGLGFLPESKAVEFFGEDVVRGATKGPQPRTTPAEPVAAPRDITADFDELNTFSEDEEPDWETALATLRHYSDTSEGEEALSQLEKYRDHYLSLDPETAFDDEGLVERFHDWDNALQELAVSRGYRVDGDSGDFELDDELDDELFEILAQAEQYKAENSHSKLYRPNPNLEPMLRRIHGKIQGGSEMLRVPGVKTPVLKNPTRDEVARFLGREIPEARMMTDKEGNTYIWDAEAAIHRDVLKGLGMDPNSLWHEMSDTPITADSYEEWLYSDPWN